MSERTAGNFSLENSVELAHAWVQSLADGLPARVVFLKGPAMAAQCLRGPRASSDVDVVVSSENIAAVCEALTAAGWREREASLIATLTSTHSRTFTHPRWPCDIDVHYFYPGLLIDHRDAFEAMWSERTSVSLARQACTTTNRAASAVTLALHSLRSTSLESRHAAELELLTSVRFTPSERARIRDFVEKAGAQETLSAFLEVLGIQTTKHRASDAQSIRLWNERVASGSHGTYFWLAALKRASGDSWRRIAREAIWPTRRDLLLSRPETRDTSVGRTLARIRRWGRGARSLPRAVRAIVGARLTSRTPRRMETPWT